MRLFRAIGLILFLLFAKTILLATPYNHFQATLSQFFQTSTTALKQTENIISAFDTTQPLNLQSLGSVSHPIIDFGYLTPTAKR